MTRNRIRVPTGTMAVLGAALVVAGCGGSSDSSGNATTASLSRAAFVSTSKSGYTYDMTLHETVANQTLDATATGTASPATHDMTMDMKMSLPSSQEIGTIDMQAVEHAGTIYYKFPPSIASKLHTDKPWVSISLDEIGKADGIPGYGSLFNSSSSESDPGQYLSFLHDAANGTVDDLGQETINGVETTHYHAEVDLTKVLEADSASSQTVKALVTLLKKYDTSDQTPMDVWIGSANLVRRMKLSYSMTVQKQPITMTMTMSFLSYGKEPAPQVPSPDQTVDLLSLAKGTSGVTG